MSKGVNKVIILGHLGQDPEVRAMPQGGSAVTVSVATSEQWKDKQTGEKKESTEWHRVVFFGRLADVVAQYVHKGSKVYIEGKLQTKKWTDKSGVERYTTQILASEMQMLDSKGDGRQVGGSQPYDVNPMSHDYAAVKDGGASMPPAFSDDDIPF